MSVVVDGIGLVGTILGIWSFITDNIPAGAEQKSVFRVQVGVDGTQGLTNAGGDISLIKVYNSNNNLIGSGSGGYVTNGGFADFTAQQSNLQQALATELCRYHLPLPLSFLQCCHRTCANCHLKAPGCS